MRMHCRGTFLAHDFNRTMQYTPHRLRLCTPLLRQRLVDEIWSDGLLLPQPCRHPHRHILLHPIRSQYLSAVSSNQALTTALSKNPALVSAMVSDTSLRDLIIGENGISAALIECPGLGGLLAFDKPLVQALTQNVPGISVALAAGNGALARELVTNSALVRSLARDDELAAALGDVKEGAALGLALVSGGSGCETGEGEGGRVGDVKEGAALGLALASEGGQGERRLRGWGRWEEGAKGNG